METAVWGTNTSHNLSKVEIMFQKIKRRTQHIILNLCTIKIWQSSSLIMIWLFLLIFILKRYLKINPIISRRIIPIIAIFLLLITQFSYTRTKTDYAILFKTVDVVKSAPSENGTELFSIHAGVKMKITDQIGDWINIEIQNGKSGWILLSNVKKI